VYNYCTSVNTQSATGSSTGGRASGSRANARFRQTGSNVGVGNHNSGAQFVGQELYKRLKEFLNDYLSSLIKVGTRS
jgi:hypothetical protein